MKIAIFISSARDDLRDFPRDVRRVMGVAINDAQEGGEHPRTKALTGFGGRNVLEVADDFDGDTFRAVYTIRSPKPSMCCMPSRKNPRLAKRRAGMISS